MDDAIYTIAPGREPTEEEVDQMIVSDSSVWRDPDAVQITLVVPERDAERRLARQLSAPPTYHYRGRTSKCFFPTRKTRWRKG